MVGGKGVTIMLGEKVIEERGTLTGTRVLSGAGGETMIEVSFRATGHVLGIEHVNFGTYTAVMTPSGVLRGQGQGMFMTKDGDTGTWSGGGVGKPSGKGFGATWRGAIYFQTASPKLARLNGVAIVFEHEADADGNVSSTNWEWK
jgi:hypothetical protein